MNSNRQPTSCTVVGRLKLLFFLGILSFQLPGLGEEITGIGIQIIDRKATNEPLRISKVYPGSPAEAAGIPKRPAFLISVDGTNVVQMSLSEASLSIRGPVGTPVTVEIADSERLGTNKFTAKRKKINIIGGQFVFSE